VSDPLPPHSARFLLVRVAAAILVIVAAIAIDDALDDEHRERTRGARLVDFSVDSRMLGAEQPVSVVIPKGARDGRRSLLVFLHGRGADHESYLGEELYAALARQGGTAPLVAFPRSNPDSYWHDREGGSWGSNVVEEVVPRLVERFDIEPERVAIGGISMGGFGAFSVARLDPGAFCAIGAHSPAIWERGADTAPGAFDDESDFAANDLISLARAEERLFAGRQVWIDVGADDPFAEAAEMLAEALDAGGARVSFRLWQGAHEDSYWRSNWRRYMRFYADALKRCGEASR
jgi:enterochelin esterase-like enzyme